MRSASGLKIPVSAKVFPVIRGDPTSRVPSVELRTAKKFFVFFWQIFL